MVVVVGYQEHSGPPTSQYDVFKLPRYRYAYLTNWHDIAYDVLITHVTDLWVLRLRLWDLLRWMLAANSTVLSDDLGLKHFNAQE